MLEQSQSQDAVKLNSAISRRDAIRLAMAVGTAIGVTSKTPELKASENSTAPSADFVPENDYPYFGYDPDSQ